MCRVTNQFLRRLCIGLAGFLALPPGAGAGPETVQVAVQWQDGGHGGTVQVLNGTLLKIEIDRGRGEARGDSFSLAEGKGVRMVLFLADASMAPGSGATIVTVKDSLNPFSFFLRDVQRQWPICIPEYRAAVTEPGDARSYTEIETVIRGRGQKTRLQQTEAGPEESFEHAALQTRNQPCPTLLGTSRDMRIFELTDGRTSPGSEMDLIRPRNASSPVVVPELKGRPLEYGYVLGRGRGAAVRVSRRLEDGVLPILHATVTDGDIEYHSTAFVSLETSPLTGQAAMGTDFLVADAFSGGHLFTKGQEALLGPRLAAESTRTESTVLYCRVKAINTAAVPRYAWLKTVRPGGSWWVRSDYAFERTTGFSTFSSGRVFALSRLNGRPLPDEEVAVLLQPGGTAVLEFALPHTPIPRERATLLARESFDDRYGSCRRFWLDKLRAAARITVPEKRITEMIRAGLLQMDLVTYGREPAGTLAPTLGAYAPIGTESAPMVLFECAAGLSSIARRSLEYFLEKQHEDGMIQNFGGYMVETGAALWALGEYFRYTGDREWVRAVEPRVLRSCDYLLRLRRENQRAGLEGRGYGMIAGKVADPEDPFHQFMLNAYAYLGISRAAEMLKAVDSMQSRRLAAEAEAWKRDIRASLSESISRSPVVPLGDGRWSPTVPPWTEAAGPKALHVGRDLSFSHGTVAAADALLGPLYLVFGEVLAPEERAARMLLEYQSELFYEDNAAFSQPYYSRHDWLQLRLGLVKGFLKTYYTNLAAMADRETYTFWEHTFQVSPHKTHELAWFLMETRWMLYLEEGETLRLLPGVPRAWMEDGKQIDLEGVRTYFGALSLRVDARPGSGFIQAEMVCSSGSRPRNVVIRLPHPQGKKAVRVTGGTYDAATESVLVREFAGSATVRAEF